MKTSAIVSLAAIALFMASPAHAYVDPGTGGMLIQLMAGGIAGIAVLGRLYWTRLKATLAGDSSRPEGAKTESPDGRVNDRV